MRHVATGWLRPFLVGASGLWVVALLVLAAAPASAAVTSLTVTTTYPTVQVDPGGQVDLPILVQSPTPPQVDLSVNNVPDGFKTTFRGGGFIVSSVYTSGNDASPAPTDLKLRVEVPATATSQDYNHDRPRQQQRGLGGPADHAQGRVDGGQRRQPDDRGPGQDRRHRLGDHVQPHAPQRHRGGPEVLRHRAGRSGRLDRHGQAVQRGGSEQLHDRRGATPTRSPCQPIRPTAWTPATTVHGRGQRRRHEHRAAASSASG